MHDCQIFHSDIKPDNALIFTSSQGTAQNWIAKLCDFSHSRLEIHEERRALYSSEIGGTEKFFPPERYSSDAIPISNLPAIDVWCWGMLLWYILIDGDTYKTLDGRELERESLRQEKQNGLIQGTAVKSCQSIYNEQQHNNHILSIALEALHRSLDYDPKKRAPARDLLRGMKHGLDGSTPASGPAVALSQTCHLPPFDVGKQEFRSLLISLIWV